MRCPRCKSFSTQPDIYGHRHVYSCLDCHYEFFNNEWRPADQRIGEYLAITDGYDIILCGKKGYARNYNYGYTYIVEILPNGGEKGRLAHNSILDRWLTKIEPIRRRDLQIKKAKEIIP